MELLITLAALTLIAFALEHTRNRHPHRNPHLAGSTDIIDRDTERITAELRTRP